ncbi:TonB family protein [Allochromatium vinosum DSM 180]|uniref:TonB family protein n=1 Tax=Allochromatium vinosum (strain ATCC 17899 / DSM 180 / NBRC 103801 / NCIMB 10441 / D) TaxID=572477 RepID=D3RN25_ALLVD|nr:TonB family protein [Allochromatium vinosum DSM 180]
MPHAADRPAGRTWLWLALLLSAALHVAVAAVLWRTERSYSTEPEARPLVFELVRPGADEAATDEPPHDHRPSSPETASVPSASANDDAMPVPPAPVQTPARSPVDPVAFASRATKPVPKTSQRPTRPVRSDPTPKQADPPPASAPRSTQASEPRNQRPRPPSTRHSAATGSATEAASARNSASPVSPGRTQTTQPGESAAGQRAAERAYLTALQRAIARHQRYPAGARRHGQTGVTTLAFVIEADGRIGQIRLAQSSGHASLDQAALQALTRLGRFDPIPRSIGRSRWSLRIPIRFDLK